MYSTLSNMYILLIMLVMILSQVQGNSAGDIRLIRGVDNESYEGRIEVFYEGNWVSVSQNGWSKVDALVACRQLGYTVHNIIPIATRGRYYGPGTGNVAIMNIACIGNESSVLDCPFQVDREHERKHYQDAGLRCVPKVVANNSICQYGDVRLISYQHQTGANITAGRVEICIGNVWGTIVRSFFHHTEARVVCRQLDYYDSFARIQLDNFPIGARNEPIHLSRVNCTGDEESILDCEYNGPSFADDHTKDAGVYCFMKPTTPNCTFGDIHLVNGYTTNEGTVELCIAGVWGTIVDSLFDDKDAMVVCRQLGYNSENAIAYGKAHFGQGTGPIYFKYLQCQGTEDSVLNCPYFTYLYKDDHSHDAGVKCHFPSKGDIEQQSYSIQLSIVLSYTNTIHHNPITAAVSTATVSPTMTHTTDSTIVVKDRIIAGTLIGTSVVLLGIVTVTTIGVIVLRKHLQKRSKFVKLSDSNTSTRTTRSDIMLLQ